ncbi:MAG: hypothetical protein FJ296_07080 [Planctomycetes bacterium]|nr:hypothetical protein [Planctomycetota bacterium]
MKRTVIVLALALAACGGDPASGTTAPQAKPGEAKPAAKPAADAAQPKAAQAAPPSIAGVDVPTQDQADAQAAAAITEANADAEFEKLQKELAGEKP